jgi:hypothetical protein
MNEKELANYLLPMLPLRQHYYAKFIIALDQCTINDLVPFVKEAYESFENFKVFRDTKMVFVIGRQIVVDLRALTEFWVEQMVEGITNDVITQFMYEQSNTFETVLFIATPLSNDWLPYVPLS